ncbi:FKBP-type peptidyl-prolyl cis-trans isomerase [Chitinophaga sp. CF118]|uniref:FKBP-type peptidyl-prolyl cis-trans isomerase n=1 Tax=Chitinophaga sp. CF118 TaxID=1884367 RepID=UPI0008DEFBD6|nr:FKBP-type peptidyl-prolyl cis-trans isomerase [Chitinophaga sp. CF118]SFE86802.1 FKBP-type peptidyl-prolyl cis-trans isomerase [Chitinophaga sp. CF118]
MRNLLLLSGLFVLLMTACKKDDAPVYVDPYPQFAKDTAAIGVFLAANNLEAVKDSSGIFYKIENPGNGVDSVRYEGTTVTVLYRGNIMGNTAAFDSTGTTPRPFVYGQLIRGFRFAVRHITKGGKITVYLPSFYGYGMVDQNGIPANSILVFHVEMTDITDPK